MGLYEDWLVVNTGKGLNVTNAEFVLKTIDNYAPRFTSFL